MKHYTIDGVTTDTIPNPCHGDSPVSEAHFIELGGTITDDGEPTPQEKFLAGLDTYLEGLEDQVEALGLSITIDEFKAAAGSMMSTELIAWARSKEVPESMIESVRNDILTMIADASRIGMTWTDIFPKVEA